MRQFLNRFALTVLLSALSLPTFLVAQDAISDTPAGRRLAELIDAVNSSDEQARNTFLSEGFENSNEETLTQRIAQTAQVRSQLGKLELKKIVSSANHRITAELETSNGPRVVLALTVGESEPHKITLISLEFSQGGDNEPVDESPLDQSAKSDAIDRLAEELRAKYVFPELGEEMAAAVEKSLADGAYDEIEDVREFASQLTDQLREICNDRHLRIRAGTPRRPSETPTRRRVDNHGFVKAEALPGGVGYLKFNFFSGEQVAEETAAAAMNFLANSRALIFDLRENGGGSPRMIAFLTSYLYEEPVHLNSFYNRPTDTTTESWTRENVPGPRFSPNVPVYVLTSSYTFSGAEEFSYNLQNLKRGTIVGETTGGGAHPVMPVVLGKRLHMSMPFARAINPITNTNWEGVGVKPDVEVTASEALEKAIELARAKIEELEQESEVADAQTADEPMNDEPTNDEPTVDVSDLMQRGQSLMTQQSFDEAAKLYGEVTRAAPENGLAWMRYGYCLHISGKLDQAIEAHRQAATFDQFAGIATYNLACAYSLKNQAEKSLSALEKAIELGFGDAQQLESDSDFDNLRDNSRFKELLKKLRDGS